MTDPIVDAAPPLPYAFEEFERRARLQRQRRLRRVQWLRAGWVASLAGVALLAWFGSRGTPSGGAVPARAGSVEADMTSGAFDATRAASVLAPTAVVRVDARLNAIALEDHIALVDHLLSDARVHGDPLLEMQRLERERARLVDSLVMIRRAESLMVEAR